MTQVKTAISIQEILFEETENIAREMKIPRSQVVSLALQEFIQRYRNRKLLKEINAAYEVPATEDEVESLEKMRSHQRSVGGDEVW